MSADEPPAAPALDIEVVRSPAPDRVDSVRLRLPAGSTVAQALRASGLLGDDPALDPSPGSVGVWGRAVGLERLLVDGDRVELYRPLKVDPKEARRLRARDQRARGPSGNRSR